MGWNKGKNRLPVLLLSLFIFLWGVGVAYGVELEQQLDNTRQQLNRAQEQAGKARETVRDYQREVAQINNSINEKDLRITELEGDLRQTQGDLRQKEGELAAAEARLEENTEIFSKRVRSMYEMGNVSYLEVLLDSQDFSDFVTRYELLQKVVEQDQNIINEIKEERRQINLQKEELERLRNKLTSMIAEQEKLRKELQTAQSARKALLDEASAQLYDFEAAASRLQEQEMAIVRQIAAKKRAEGGQDSPLASGSFVWPVPSSKTITSQFGMRVHPVYGSSRMHNGLDIAASSGATVLAAQSGEVLKSGYEQGFGNAVYIYHGGGVITVYGHLSARLVSTGDLVTAGQTIGRVGSTGVSTGPHLHFQVDLNGKSVSPWNYL